MQPWEWCIAHLLNRVIIDAFGICLERGLSKNTVARDVLDMVKRVIESINKSSDRKVRD